MEEGLARDVVEALADLSPAGEHQAARSVTSEWFRWLPVSAVALFDPAVQAGAASDPALGVRVERDLGERLAAVDRVRAGAHALRLGWLFVAGTPAAPDGRPSRRVFAPLVTMPVKVRRPPLVGAARLVPAGDTELTGLVADPVARADFEATLEFGGGVFDGAASEAISCDLLGRLTRLQAFARRAAAVAGLPATEVVPAERGPDEFARARGLVVVAGVAVYADTEVPTLGRGPSLRAWAPRLSSPTALHALYFGAPAGSREGELAREPVDSPHLLAPAQREAVRRSRTAAVTTVSGAPGTGKSHTAVAIACDALSRGERVLVAAKSDAAVDALVDLLERSPGPDPVVFGSNSRRNRLAQRLAGGQEVLGEAAVRSAQRLVDAALARRDALLDEVRGRLDAERRLELPEADVELARWRAPGLFDGRADLGLARRLADELAAPPASGWLRRRRARRAQAALAALAGLAPDELRPDELGRHLELAERARAASLLLAAGGTQIGARFDELLRAEDELRAALGRWLAVDGRSSRRLDSKALAATAALATALRSGRAARRQQLLRLEDDGLTRALPLWIGTLADVEDLLPPVPALFDLVVLDEASSIDQPLAAPALLRARRAVVVGDPRQLRHVSFVADEDVQQVLRGRGLAAFPALAARLDVRRNSAFDAAAGAAPVLRLDEHFRSAPHLIDFVARSLYDGELAVATRSPRSESEDCVEVVRCEDRSGGGEGKVVRAEVEAALDQLGRLRATGCRSAAVVTPFRAQADALEAAVLSAFSADELDALDLLVGTVHELQGNERDVVVASLGVGRTASRHAWRFAEEPHLLAVLLTRARRRLVVVHAADPPEGGLLAGFLAQADAPPGRPAPAPGGVAPWTAEVAEHLREAGLGVAVSYPVGRHVVELAWADPAAAGVALECTVHPNGSTAHVERRLALRRSGWRVLEAYRSRWGDRVGELAAELATAPPGPWPEGPAPRRPIPSP